MTAHRSPARLLTRCTVAALVLQLSPRSALPADELPQPQSSGSYTAYVAHLDDAGSLVYQQLLDRYNAYLRRVPLDVVALVERCRFMGAAECSDEYGDCRHWQESDACIEELKHSHPQDPEVILLALERQWGDEAIEAALLALGERGNRWTDEQTARLHEKLVSLYEANQLHQEVADHAVKAMQLDPSMHLHLEAARAFEELGDRASAISITLNLPMSEDYWEQRSQVELLVDLEQFKTAADLLSEMKPPDGFEPDHLVHARI